jgi:hypothetical protein
MLRLDDAGALLGRYRDALVLHMQFEEQHLFPAYAELPEQGRWAASLYVQEHRKIQKLLEACSTGLEWLREQRLDASQMRRNVIALIDREKTLKGLLEHHEAREEESMLPLLDAGAPAFWRRREVAAFRNRWSRHLKHTATTPPTL